ncbi:hypothetical protein [Amycolatopsis magusensis]|uniref:hypothetical protein n=1 Tax=Amycolatopsis magusensis TaxID=882444 RepID=UPI0037AD0085
MDVVVARLRRAVVHGHPGFSSYSPQTTRFPGQHHVGLSVPISFDPADDLHIRRFLRHYYQNPCYAAADVLSSGRTLSKEQFGGGGICERGVAQVPRVRAARRKLGEPEVLDERPAGFGEQDLWCVVGDRLGRSLAPGRGPWRLTGGS